MRDANGQQLAYVYYGSEPGRRSAAKLLSKDEARRIAANIAKLLELMDRTKNRVPRLAWTAIEHQVIHITFERATVG